MIRLSAYIPEAIRLVGLPGSFARHRGKPFLSAPMDYQAFLWGKKLLGNNSQVQALEVAFGKIDLSVEADTVLSVTGMETRILLNGVPVVPWSAFRVTRGDQVSIRPLGVGQYAYINAAGGFDKLINDSLRLVPAPDLKASDQGAPRFFYHSTHSVETLSVYLNDEVPEEVRSRLISRTFLVGQQSSRMGVRLEATTSPPVGKGLESLNYSVPVFPGDIQCPPGGEPIVLSREAQTMGGYPLLGALTEASLSKLTQLVPGQMIQFSPLSFAEWKEALDAFNNFFRI